MGSLARVLSRIPQEWQEFLRNARTPMMSALEATLEQLEKDPGLENIEPAPENILEALRYVTPQDVRVVIVGQDPYPQQATGLAFSTAPGIEPRDSLRNIMKAIPGMSDAAGASPAGKALLDGDLRSWAHQGVLLLNVTLTTTRGKSRVHKKLWDFSSFVTDLLCELAQAHAFRYATRLVFLAWGGDAQKLVKRVTGPILEADQKTSFHHILEWSHPSPMADNGLPTERKFENCGHFLGANELIKQSRGRPIEWNPRAPVYAFTDGGCKRNGKPDADASFGIAFSGGALGGTHIAGRVQPVEYALYNGESAVSDIKDLVQGTDMIDTTSCQLSIRPVKGTTVPPTNNRGEYLAGCYAIMSALVANVRGPIEFVSDSELFIKTMTEWYPNRLKTGKTHEMKNLDLVTMGWILLKVLERQTSVKLIHCNAAHDRSPPASGLGRLYWHGNQKADGLCDEVIGGKKDAIIPVSEREYGITKIRATSAKLREALS